MSDQERPPFISFEIREVEDRAASQENGFYTTKNVDYAVIIPLGTKDKIERVASEYEDYLQQCVRGGRFKQMWLDEYRAAYKAWKAGHELPVNGFPLRNWPVLSPAQGSLLMGLGLRTVEELAESNEEVIRRLGMGGRTLVTKAQEFINAKEPSKTAERIADLEMKLQNAMSLVEELANANKSLQAKLQPDVA